MLEPPVARRTPVARLMFGDRVVDEYAWLRDREDPDTLPYLEAENAYTDETLAHLSGLQDEIFSEIKRRTQETDMSAPVPWDDWWYATRTVEGRQYPIFVRMHGAPDGPEQVLVDANELAEGHDHLGMGVLAVSPDHRLVAYSTDTDGSESYTLRIREIATGTDLPDVITGTYTSAAWSADGSELFYTTFDAAHRPDRVWRHTVGTDPGRDVVVFEEPDERMFVAVGTTSDRTHVVVEASSQVTADVHAIRSDEPAAPFRPVRPRIHGVQYSVDHHHGRWLVVTDEDAPNGRLLSVSVDDPDDETTLIAHEETRKVASVRAFVDHVVVSGRVGGLRALTVIGPDGTRSEMEFDEAVYTVGLGANRRYETSVVRIGYQSMTTPPRVIDVDLESGERTVIKEMPVLGGYDPGELTSERLWATAPDGTAVPISIVGRLDAGTPGPLVLYGYGSYEVTQDPTFSIARLSLLDRGVRFAIAHPRGGGAMGRLWYEDGKLGSKTNTFTDFVAAAEHLVDAGYTTPDRLAIRGGSAGGLLMGAAVNLRPDLFRVVLAHVPFVDVVNTMLDETLPLTVIEWEEWGNPKIEEEYGWIRSYAPYENVRDGDEYPAMFITAGLNDARVPYWEAAKWTARLRATTTQRGPIVLRTEMGAGHSGRSGRYDAWKEEAEALSFLLDQLGVGSDG